MSDDELSDDMQELNDLIAEYRSKDEEEDDKEDTQRKNNEDESKTDDEDRTHMDKVLFGDKAKLIKNLEKAVATTLGRNDVGYNKVQSDEEEFDGTEKASEKKAKKRKPVWDDPDDTNIQLGEVKLETKRTGPLDHLKLDKSYKEYLTSRFTRIVNQPKWASLDRNDKKESDEDDELLHTVGFLGKTPQHILTSGHLEMKRLKDLNRCTYGEGAINCIEFHPSSTAALVAGDNGVATIYAVDGTKNEKLHNIHIAKFPIKCARLLPCGTKAIFGSNRPVVYFYDLINAKETRFKFSRGLGYLSNFKISPCGRYVACGAPGGIINIFEASTFEMIKTLKQNDEVASICFTSDSKRLIVSGKSSNVCVFSMREQKLEHRFVDDGCILGRAMDLSPNQRMLATGSREGVVNVYDFGKVMLSKAPLPDKTFLNLRTDISCVKFNHSSELLAFSSSSCENAVKIAHFPSASVYSNFPFHMPKYGHVRTLAFSPQSGYFAMGNKSSCPLFRIKHFQNY